MRYFRIIVGLLLILANVSYIAPQASAAPSETVVISQLYPGQTGAATQEFVELYNRSKDAVDVTNWCITYTSSTGNTTSTLGCLMPPDDSTALWLKAGEHATFMSTDYQTAHTAKGDVSFAAGIAASAGHVRLLDGSKKEIDKLGWGTAVDPETKAASAPANGKALQRKALPDSTDLQDTDNNADDFVDADPVVNSSGIYEIVTVVDVCPNIDGVQSKVPDGLTVDQDGNCVVPATADVCSNIEGVQADVPDGYMAQDGACYQDMCSNLTGLQKTVPEFYDQSTNDTCTEHDVCSNLTGAQHTVPSGYKVDGDTCVLDLLPLQLTEVLPNADGSDTGGEYIELYNPTDRTADLGLYTLYVGSSKSYDFPVGSTVGPGQYVAFYNSQINFTLVNTTSKVSLTGTDGTPVSQTDTYTNPADGEAWALIDGTWQYTNRPTPAAANLPSQTASTDTTAVATPATTTVTTTDCPVGKYRNPLTNRCRNIETDTAVLGSCASDQYRSPETGRCRKVTVTTQTPCKEGQIRSEDTGRCRTATTTNQLAACKDGQERSPDTNRCRTIAASVPAAGFPVEPVKDGAKAFIGWWVLGGIGLLATGYGMWEWRYELMNFMRRVTPATSK